VKPGVRLSWRKAYLRLVIMKSKDGWRAGYSARRASMGLTLAARRAGT